MASLTFTVEGKPHELDIDRLTFAEGRAVEKVTGVPYGTLMSGLGDGSLEALQGFLWVAMKRTQPELKFADLDSVAVMDVQVTDTATDAPDEGGPTPDPSVSEAAG